MAKKRIVSSKKNAPSHALSSKEAALQGRVAADGDDGGNDDARSPASSSVLSSDDDGDVDLDEEDEEAAALRAVEVLPASVGRGKQLRFPAIVSRGKEARPPADSDDEDGDARSDSDESLLSIDSDAEEDAAEAPSQASCSQDAAEEPRRQPQPQPQSVAYPIKAARARKRHRPESGYYKQMSTFVRDCLLSVRDGAEAADVFREEAHHAEFRRRLADGTVERVTWKEPPPNDPVESTPPASGGDSAAKKNSKKSARPSSSQSSIAASTSKPSTSSPPKRDSSSRSSDSRDSKKARPSSSSDKKRSSSSDKPRSSSSRSSQHSSSNGTAGAAPKTSNSSTQTDPQPDPVSKLSQLCSKCKEPLKSEKPQADTKVKKESSSPKKMKSEKQQSPAATESTPVTPAPPTPVIEGSFTIPTSGVKDVMRLRNEANALNEEARRLKHEGNRRGTSVAGTRGQVAAATYYLRSGAKFFENALKLQDVKAAYKEVGDNQHARSFGDYSITTLTQTSSLIESTVRTFQSAGNTRLMALAYKMASIVHLAIYRLQHLKLFSLYSETFTPGRSPEIRSNGTTPPISGGPEGGSKDAAVRTHLLKEMEHTLRGFEMWRRYESCKVQVLPRVTSPSCANLDALFEDLEAELSSSGGNSGGGSG